MIETIIKEENWRIFQEITGDNNKLHSDEEYAKKTIFKGKIAPGMYVASLKEKEPVDSKRLILRFYEEIRHNDEITIDSKMNWINQRNRVVIKGTIYERYKAYKKDLKLEDLADLQEFSYNRKISKEDVNKFWKAIGLNIEQRIDSKERIKVPGMYVVSLIVPSLLKHSGEMGGEIGMYHKQDFNFYKDVFIGDIIFSYSKIINERNESVDFITLCVNQENEIIVKGKASCRKLY